jgi:hypothetical protein
MKNKYFLSLFLGMLCLFAFSQTQAQEIAAKKPFSSYWETGINVGSSLFFGDVKQNPIIPLRTNNNEWRLGASIMGGYQFTPVFGLRGQALYGQLAGTRRAADYFFEGDYLEFNLNTTIDLNNLFGKKRSDRFASAYLLVGLGITNYNSTIYALSSGQQKRQIGFGNGSGIGGRTLEGIITGGVGVNFRINNHFVINLETANRIMNSDNMDGWNKGFKYDIYNYTSVGLTYRFRHKKEQHTPPLPTAHQNVREVPPVSPEPEKAKQPATVEIQPVSPPAAVTDTTENPPHKIVQQKPKAASVAPPKKQPKPQPVVEYRVQIRAKYGQPVDVAWLSRKFHLPQNVIKQDKHAGYFIYTVGSFNTYEQARAKRDELRNQFGIHDAFVVAFKNGYRLDKLP